VVSLNGFRIVIPYVLLRRSYREQQEGACDHRTRIILQMAPDFEHLPLIKKIEVFRHTLEQTTGLDLLQSVVAEEPK